MSITAVPSRSAWSLLPRPLVAGTVMRVGGRSHCFVGPVIRSVMALLPNLDFMAIVLQDLLALLPWHYHYRHKGLVIMPYPHDLVPQFRLGIDAADGTVIFLVEDNPADVRLIHDALKEHGVNPRL